jgi:hypothetical protein
MYIRLEQEVTDLSTKEKLTLYGGHPSSYRIAAEILGKLVANWYASFHKGGQ